jgi:hypothetical protein
MFPVRYELNSYILFKRNSVFKGLITRNTIHSAFEEVLNRLLSDMARSQQTELSSSAFSRGRATWTTGVDSRSRNMGFVALQIVFSEYFSFPCQF